ncbi:MAG: MATE family efflux transporter [Lachnospiraceae bacterium]|nr:MATE family efflux transporter [Lachnospiraceae bacterium]
MTGYLIRDKEFYKNILRIGLPIVLQGMLTMGVNMADTIMLGRMGEVQLAGSSLANEFINIFMIMCMGMGYGAAVLTAKYWGSRELLLLKKIMTIMLRVCLSISLIFTILALIVPGAIMGIFSNETPIIESGIRYFQISAFTFVPMGITLTTTAVLRSVRETKFPLYMSILALFTNIFFNWVFIFGHLGAPRMEIKGAALGTLISRLIEMGCFIWYLLKKDQKIRYRLSDFFVHCSDQVGRYIRFCIPVLISDTLLGLGNSMAAVVMGHIGASFVAANAIIAQVVRLSTVFNQGVSSAGAVMTGNTIGSGEREKARLQGITFWILSILVGIVAALIILAVSPLVILAFNITAETKAIAFEMMWAVAIMVVFQTVQSMLTKGVLRGGGDTRYLMIADILFLWCLSIPLGYYTGIVWKCTPFIVYCALKADWAVKSVICTHRLFKGNWIKM